MSGVIDLTASSEDDEPTAIGVSAAEYKRCKKKARTALAPADDYSAGEEAGTHKPPLPPQNNDIQEIPGPGTLKSPAARRLQKELPKFRSKMPPGMSAEIRSLDLWIVSFVMPSGTVYAGEEHRLRLKFDNNYPLEAPEVTFLRPAPIHPHVYSNGHICLSTLHTDWSPALTVESLCISIQSMLSSCSAEEKKPPDGDMRYVRSVGNRSPKQTRWDFHDDKC